MRPKLTVWQCDELCCSVLNPSRRHWRLGVDRSRPFGAFSEWQNAIRYALMEWSA